ncbi:MAG: ROK family protein [Bifidobacteriaceae bacterium]|jgi:predicted NBD/HSP70 family sugar kinase|nr:ROK family protein [Bifidobacteriaceae bacterium]
MCHPSAAPPYDGVRQHYPSDRLELAVARRETLQSGPGSRALVVDIVRSSGPISRVELVEATGLTQPAISNIVRGLITDGVIRETGATVATGAKPRVLLAINSSVAYGVGLHVGMDAVTCAVTNTRGGIVGRQLAGLEGGTSREPPISQLAELCHRTIDMLGLPAGSIAGVTVAGRGPADVQHGLLPSLQASQPGSPASLRTELEQRLSLPVLVAANADAAAVGEFWVRQVSRERTFGCLYLGTELSAGLVLDGALFRGASSNAGQIGHVPMSPDGPPCPCGNRGCVNLYVTPAAVVNQAWGDSELVARMGLRPDETTARTFDILARAAILGDREARALLDVSAVGLADSALTLVNLWDIDTLVLAGPGFAVAGSLYVQEIRRRLAASAFARSIHAVRVDLSNNPRDSVAIGGAALVLQGSVAPGHGPLVAQSVHSR